MSSREVTSPPKKVEAVLDYQRAGAMPNRPAVIEAEKSDAQSFREMAFWLLGFLVVGAALALAKWMSTPTP